MNSVGKESTFKGSVQQKLWAFETGVNQYVWALDRGAGHYFIILLAAILFPAYFCFRSVLPNLWASSGIIGEVI